MVGRQLGEAMPKRISEKTRELAFSKLINLLAYSDSNKSVAALLGKSERTIRRWKHDGRIPDKSLDQIKETLYKQDRKLERQKVSFEKKTKVKPIPRPIEQYYTTKFDGRRVLYVLTAGIPCDELIYILLRKANQTSHISGLPIYTGFFLKIKQTAPKVFRWDGEKKVQRGGYVIDSATYNTIYFDINQDSKTLADIIRKYCRDGEQEVIKIGFSATRQKYHDGE